MRVQHRKLVLICLLSTALAHCGSGRDRADAGARDAGPDSGSTVDASAEDGGADRDSGSEADSGATDGGITVRLVDGDVAPPRACDAVCADEGLQCLESYAWGLGSGGALFRYGADCEIIGTCSTVAGLELDCLGETLALSRVRCACF